MGLTVLVLATAVVLLGIAFGATPVAYDRISLLVFCGIYTALAAVLVLGTVAARRVARPLGGLAALGVGAVLVWHLREQALVPTGRVAFGVSVLVVAAVWLPLVARVDRGGPVSRALPALGVALALAVVGLAVAHQGSNVMRWHLLRHNKLLGTPLHLLVDEPVQGVCSELWERRIGDSPSRAAFGPGPLRATPGSPNVVVLMIDTLRADALSPWGGTRDRMPRLDAIARSSWVFSDVLANASWTRPSVASLFTGLRAEQHGAVDRPDRLRDDNTTLAEIFLAGGWRTAAFVANWGAAGRDAGFHQGFERFEQLDGAPWPYARAEQVNRAVEKWLEAPAPAPRRPAFLYVHYLDPHDPYLSGGPREATRAEDGRRAYLAELAYLDAYISELVDRIERQLSGPSVILFLSDHGEEFGEHAERGHGKSLYREVVHLPVFLRTPSGASGTSLARLEERDLFELLLLLARDPELDPSRWGEARSRAVRYTSIYTSTPGGPHRPYLRHVCMRGVDGPEGFAIWSAYGRTHELYDLTRDAAQTRNLSSREPERLEALLDRMEPATGSWHPREPVDASAETEAMLRALGYVE